MSNRPRHYKRNKDRKGGNSNHNRNEAETPVDEQSPVIMSFREFQLELDAKHDRYERLVKISRDITIDSKRVIFGLHRIKSENKTTVLTEASSKIKDIQSHFYKVARELIGLDAYQYVRAYSPGLQEYIEAVSYHHYLKEEKLVTLKQVQDELKFTQQQEDTSAVNITDEIKEDKKKETEAATHDVADPSSSIDTAVNSSCEEAVDAAANINISVLVTPMDYVLGIADLTGELMRLAINSIGAGDLDLPFKLCCFIREIHDAFVLLGNQSRELPRKLSVLRQSLHKVEAACYTLQVRGSEIPKHMLADVIVATPVTMDYENEECRVDEN